MSQLGYKATLAGSVSGSITKIKECAIGGLKANVINVVAIDDTNQISENLKGAITEAPITATIIFNKTVYAALQTAITADAETWTLTDSGGNKWSGSGWLSALSNVRMSPSGEQTYDIEITPVTRWEYTAAA